MRVILAFALPPLAVLLCGKPLRALLNILLTACFWIPGVVHALVIVYGTLYDERTDRTLREMESAIARHRPEVRSAFARRRRRSFLVQVTVGLTLLPAGYVLSTGPLEWLVQRGDLPDLMQDLVRLAYLPLDWAAQRLEWLARLLDGYRQFWAT